MHFNAEKAVFHCKVCGEKGSYLRLQEVLAEALKLLPTSRELQRLAKDRNLPVEAFEGFEIGHTGAFYVLAIRDVEGRLTDLRRYKLGGKWKSAPGCRAGLLGAPGLAEKGRSRAPVYVCEGEGDTLSFDWLLRSIREPGITVGVPGANTFKNEWVEWFRGRRIALLYDNDEPGVKGQARTSLMLRGVAASIRFIQWRKDDKPGCDIRDLIGGLK